MLLENGQNHSTEENHYVYLQEKNNGLLKKNGTNEIISAN